MADPTKEQHWDQFCFLSGGLALACEAGPFSGEMVIVEPAIDADRKAKRRRMGSNTGSRSSPAAPATHGGSHDCRTSSYLNITQ